MRAPLALLLLCTLPACAIHSVYKRCGFQGCAGDAQITAEVRTRFGQYPSLQAPNAIRVQTLDRVVYLYGLVDSDTERLLADSLAREAPGVRRVVDAIGLDYGGR